MQPRNEEPNRFLGTRFDREGKFLPERGNTVVRHVIPGSDSEAALVELRAALMALPYGGHFAYTVPESYHMTVFEGVIDTRRQPRFWPDNLPFDVGIDHATHFLDERLATFSGPGTFEMRPVQVIPVGLVLSGVDDGDEHTARAWRDALVAPFGYRSPQHDGYVLHATLAYIKDRLPEEAIALYREAMTELTVDFIDAVPTLELGPSAFCSFEDMNAFPVMRLLDASR